LAGYSQVKVSVKTEIAEPYKAACKKSGVSMASDLTEYMAKRSGKLEQAARRRSACTRGRRRQRLFKLADELEAILAEESAYRDKIPENLTGGMAYEAAESTIELLEEALELLHNAFS
jgi:hypothetical protein